MTSFHIIAILITLTALLSYVNHRWIHLHATVGVMLAALLLSLVLIALGHFVPAIRANAQEFLQHVPFGEALLQWMLGFLLFAGALNVDVNEMMRHRWLIAALATVGTVLSMLILGGMAWLILRLVGFHMSLIESLLLGAILSPTDPVAVLGMMKRVGASKEIENVIAAESLFNDGVGVVLFLTLLGLSRSDVAITLGGAIVLFLQQSIGGAVLGFITGWGTYQLLKRVQSHHVEILLTLALVMGSYTLADALHVSGPIAVVVAGLLICNHGRMFDLASDVSDDVWLFWELIDEILNAILFLLIGLQVMVMPYSTAALIAAVLMILAALLARWISVAGIVRVFRNGLANSMVRILVWGGLRGGLAVAMALSLPSGVVRDRFVVITYVVVIFSIVVQGTTTGALVQRSAERVKIDG
jgi:CPA1 family monovalent cation:H+ antiporter